MASRMVGRAIRYWTRPQSSVNSDLVALRQEIHSCCKHQHLEFHATVLNKPAVLGMDHRDCASHDDDDKQSTEASQSFVCERADDKCEARPDFAECDESANG